MSWTCNVNESLANVSASFVLANIFAVIGPIWMQRGH